MSMNDDLKRQVLDTVKAAVALTSDKKTAEEANAHQLLRDVERMIRSGEFKRQIADEGDYHKTISYTVPKK